MQFKFQRAKSKQAFHEFKQRVDKAIFSRLMFVGEKFIIYARNTRTYKDRTGNLRSSIGYVILKDGVQVTDNFGTGIGKEKSVDIMWEVATQYPTGWILIGVAGMEYAAAVEAKGYDVITGGAQIAELSMKKAIEALKVKIDEL